MRFICSICQVNAFNVDEEIIDKIKKDGFEPKFACNDCQETLEKYGKITITKQ